MSSQASPTVSGAASGLPTPTTTATLDTGVARFIDWFATRKETMSEAEGAKAVRAMWKILVRRDFCALDGC